MDFNEIITLQKKRMGVGGNGGKDSIRQQFVDGFDSNLAYEKVYINESESLTGVHMMDANSYGSNTMIAKKIITLEDDTVHAGDIIKREDGTKYLCIEMDSPNGIYEKGYLSECNQPIKWISSVDGSIKESPAIVSNKSLYSTGMDQDKFYSISDQKAGFIIPTFKEEPRFYKGMRFIIDREAYEISGIDRYSKPGLSQFILTTVALCDKDNLDEEIAYNGNENTPVEPIGDYTMTIEGEDKLWPTQPSIYTCTVLNNGEPEVTDVVWSINEHGAIESTDGYSCSVKAGDIEYATIVLRCELVSDANVFVEKSIKIKGAF